MAAGTALSVQTMTNKADSGNKERLSFFPPAQINYPSEVLPIVHLCAQYLSATTMPRTRQTNRMRTGGVHPRNTKNRAPSPSSDGSVEIVDDVPKKCVPIA